MPLVRIVLFLRPQRGNKALKLGDSCHGSFVQSRSPSPAKYLQRWSVNVYFSATWLFQYEF